MGIKINLIRVIFMFSPMTRVLVQTRMEVERTLGYDLVFLSIPRQHERILLAPGITRDPRFLRDCLGNFYMTFTITLSHLHSGFLHVFLVPLGLDVDLCVETFELVYL